MILNRNIATFLVFIAIFFISACANNKRANSEYNLDSQIESRNLDNPDEFHGRIALKLESAAGADASGPQLFSGGFELLGRSQAGKLTLFSPLGGTAAVLTWSPGRARLESGGQSRDFESVTGMLIAATGADVPLTSLFAWLRGETADAPGWTVDLSQFANGRVLARRTAPRPEVELRVILERDPPG